MRQIHNRQNGLRSGKYRSATENESWPGKYRGEQNGYEEATIEKQHKMDHDHTKREQKHEMNRD